MFLLVINCLVLNILEIVREKDKSDGPGGYLVRCDLLGVKVGFEETGDPR